MKLSVLSVLLVVLGLISGFEDKTIAQWLEDNGFGTLVNALKSANLFDVLNNPGMGPFTLFAPNDNAFQAVPSDTLNSLTQDPSLMEAVLKFHVLNGYKLAPFFKDGETLTTLLGQDLQVDKSSGDIVVNGARVIQPDIVLNNGIIHVIDNVLVPTITKIESLGEILLRNDSLFSTLNLLLTITDLEPVLFSGNYTLFAPTNDAFNALAGVLPDITAPGAKDTYSDVIKNHLASGVYQAADLTNGMKIQMVSGKSYTINLNPVQINTARVISADTMASNGVLHIIDAVLM